MPPRQIILVDDEPRLLSALRRRLSSYFDIVTFERGQDALNYLSKPHNVAVIVADMQMPEMNGIELLQLVQKTAPDVRRLMLTGNSGQETAMAAINEAKVMRFIRKPCDASALKDILNETLEEYDFKQSDLSEIQPNNTETQRLEHTQQTFLSIMSHELRTPLSQIITISGILSQNHRDEDERTVTKFLEQINTSGISALGHIDRILQYTRLKSSTPSLDERESLDVVSLFRTEIDRLEASAKSKLVTVAMESIRKSAQIHATPNEMTLAVREVLQNAINFSEVGGYVSVIFRYDKDNIAIRVSNSGVIDNHSNHLQSPAIFKHEDAGLSRLKDGVGLGLSMVDLITQRNDVVFNLQQGSQTGITATFVFKRQAPISPEVPIKLAS